MPATRHQSQQSSDSTQDRQSNLSQLGAGAQYAKGAAEVCFSQSISSLPLFTHPKFPMLHYYHLDPYSEEQLHSPMLQDAVGSLIGNENWQRSRQQHKDNAHQNLDSRQQRDQAQQGFGRTEELVSQTIGYESTEREGQQQQRLGQQGQQQFGSHGQSQAGRQ
jgi:hypothetical protein